MTQRVLVITLDTLADRMAGPAIRAWRIAEALAADHDVTLVTLATCDRTSTDFTVTAITAEQVREHVEASDVVVLQGYLFRAFDWLHDCEQVLVVDLYDPFHLESLEVDRHRPPQRRRESLLSSVAELNGQLARGDFFLCASAKQRDFWLGHLGALGRINPDTYDDDPDLARLLAVVPFGVDAQAPPDEAGALRGTVPGIGADDKVLLWGGGVYNWFDPLTLIRAVDVLRADVPEVRLVFLGMKHPNPDVPEMQVAAQARRLADELGLTGRHVFFNEGWVPHDQRHRYLRDADLGVSCHYQHLETAFSFRTRILDYFWAGLPIVATDGDGFADLIRARGLGSVVQAEDVTALSEAIKELLTDDDRRAACAARVEEIATEFTWPVVLEPLVAFCRSPRRSADAEGYVARPQVTVPDDLVRPGLARDLRTALMHLREGGVSRVVTTARARLDRRRRLGR